MTRLILLATCCLLTVLSTPAQEPPAGATLNQWVREDLFAGFLAGSTPEFERGVEKLDAYLKVHPDNSSALAWRRSVDTYLAIEQLEAGDSGSYSELLDRAVAGLNRAYNVAPEEQKGATLSIAGGTAIILGDRLAPADRQRIYELGRDRYVELEQAQSGFFTNMPPHHQGEVLAGIAQLEQRLGNRERAVGYAERVIAILAGTPYEAAARAFIADPDAEPTPRLACVSCHDAGRLANVRTDD